MRILCLHGKGTSAAIFRSQTTSLRNLLSAEDIEFDFVDGPRLSKAAPGLDHFYNGPFHSFYESTDRMSLDVAHTWLGSVILERGPYDSVMCFSQGCALVSTYLILLQQRQRALPFKSAVFICGGIPLDFLESIGIHVSTSMRQYDDISRVALSRQTSIEALLTQGEQRWTVTSANGFLQLDSIGKLLISNAEGTDQKPRTSLISIPTVHIVGQKDARYHAGLQLASFCEESMRRDYDHGGGHTIPRSRQIGQDMASLVIWLAEKSK